MVTTTTTTILPPPTKEKENEKEKKKKKERNEGVSACTCPLQLPPFLPPSPRHNHLPFLPRLFSIPPTPLFFSSASLSLSDNPSSPHAKAAHSAAAAARQYAKESEERVLISEVLVRNKDGDELDRKDLESEALSALRACRPNSALTVREVQEDVHRVIDSGYFSSCMPVAVDTRDGIRLVFQVQIYI